MATFNNILIPIDFSNESGTSLPLAAQLLSGQSDPHVHIVHVLQPPALLDGYAVFSYEQVYQDIKKASEAKLDELTQQYAQTYPGIKFHKHFIETLDDAEGIVDFAKQNNIDLIIMSSHGRSGLKRVLMGSVAESVMRLSEIPVLICKSGASS